MKIRKIIPKIVAFLLVVGLNYSGILGVRETMAYFSDEEIFLNNIYSAGTLDFSLFSPHDNFIPYPKVENMEPGDVLNRMIQVRQEGSLPFKYAIRTEKISGDDEFCSALELEAKLEGEIKYPADGDSGSLTDFDFLPVEMVDPPGIDTWQFKISLPGGVSDNVQNKTCEFKFIFEGWQDDAENYEENGFDDTEEIASEASSSFWSENWIKVDYPDGGETWYVGRNYNILWETGDFDDCGGQVKIDLYYSADSGASWANIVKNAKNKGNYNWRVPLFLYNESGDMYFTASAEARIKAVATCSSDPAVSVWDISDEDFCPPIDYDLLTPEEMEVVESLGLYNNSEAGSTENDSVSEDFSGADEELESEKEINENNKNIDIEKDDEEISGDINNEKIDKLELEISGENAGQIESEETLQEEIKESDAIEKENIDQNQDEEILKEEIEEAGDLDNKSGEEASDSADVGNNVDISEEGKIINEYETENSDIAEENKGGNEDNNSGKKDDMDVKGEKFILTPKEEVLSEDDDDDAINNNDDSADGSAQEYKTDINGGNNLGNGLNKNSVDCVQAVK